MHCCLLNRNRCYFSFLSTEKPYFALSPKTLTFSVCSTNMAAARHEVETEPVSQNTPEINQNYPKPLSPPLPPISKDLEIRRAMEASSKSSLFNLTRDDVLFEDEWLLAVNKPKGVYCEAVLSSVPQIVGDSNESGRLSEGMRSNTKEFHLANRLDRDTSGVMLITKSHKVASKLVKAYTNHEVHKSYIALCIGSAPKWERITIRSGHGRSKHGAWRVYAASDVGRALPGGSIVRVMETSLQVLSVNAKGGFKELSEENVVSGFKNDCGIDIIVVQQEAEAEEVDGDKDEILVRAFPRSGRTHQIRLHCQYLGIPIRGDVKYYGVHEWKGRRYNGHELHAESVSFSHPVTDLPITIRTPLPYWVTEHYGRR